MIIKILLILGALGFGVLILRDHVPSQHQLLRRAAGLLVMVLGILAVLFPDSTNTVAHAVGVSRGADLIFYTSVMVFLYNAVAVSQRIHRLERQVAVLTRELAIATAVNPDITAGDSRRHPSSP